MAEHRPQPLPYLPQDAPALGPARGDGLGSPKAHEEQGGDQVGERVQEDGDRRGEQADERAPERGARHLRERRARLQLAVGLHQPLAPHQRRQEGDVCDAEDHVPDPREERHRVQQLDAQPVEQPGRGDRQQQRGSPSIRRDHERPAAHPVGPDADEEADQEVGRGGGRDQQAHLARRCVERQHGQQRQRQDGDLGSEAGHGLGRPEPDEVGMPPEPAGRRPDDPTQVRGYGVVHGEATPVDDGRGMAISVSRECPPTTSSDVCVAAAAPLTELGHRGSGSCP